MSGVEAAPRHVARAVSGVLLCVLRSFLRDLTHAGPSGVPFRSGGRVCLFVAEGHRARRESVLGASVLTWHRLAGRDGPPMARGAGPMAGGWGRGGGGGVGMGGGGGGGGGGGPPGGWGAPPPGGVNAAMMLAAAMARGGGPPTNLAQGSGGVGAPPPHAGPPGVVKISFCLRVVLTLHLRLVLVALRPDPGRRAYCAKPAATLS